MTQNINFTVQKGDTLWSLWKRAKEKAEKNGQKIESWNPDKIAQENNFRNPNQIIPNQEISFSIINLEEVEGKSTKQEDEIQTPSDPPKYIEVIRGAKPPELIKVENYKSSKEPPKGKVALPELSPEIEERIKALYYSWTMDYIDISGIDDSVSEVTFIGKIGKEGISPDDIFFKEAINLQDPNLPKYVEFVFNLKIHFPNNSQISPQDFMKVPLENNTNSTNEPHLAIHPQNRNGFKDFGEAFEFYRSVAQQIYISMKEFMKSRG